VHTPAIGGYAPWRHLAQAGNAFPVDAGWAREIATWVHAEQREPEGRPKLHHIASVVRASPPDAACVAWLHEVLETGAVTEQDLLRDGLDSEELRALRLLRVPTWSASEVAFLAHVEFIARAAGHSGRLARTVALADLGDRAAYAGHRSAIHVRALRALAASGRHFTTVEWSSRVRHMGIRVVLGEDSLIVREGVRQLLAGDGEIEVVGLASDMESLREVCDRERPNVVVTDIRMPPTHTDEGLRAAIDIRRDHPGVGVLVFSQYVETRYATRLLADRPSGVGYLLKDRVADVADFVDALTRVASGGTALDPEVVGHLMRAGPDTTGVASLTPREREVLALMAEGRSNAGIAVALFITPGVVEKHVANIFAKLGLPPSDSDNRRVLAVLRHLSG
jgi:DNA-binding NarL/FixJ family response regulator